MDENQRIEYIHVARGLAAISVVFSHFLGVFWTRHEGITNLMGIPALEPDQLTTFLTSISRSASLFLGIWGVCIFFIISGFVISISVMKEKPIVFFVRRIFRIYPVYIVGFLFTVGSLALVQNFTDSPYKQSMWDIIAHFTIVLRDFMGVERIDGISWTLEVELYFYLVMLFVGAQIIKHKLLALYVLSILIAGLAALKGGFVGVQISAGLLLLVGISYYQLRVRTFLIRDVYIFQVWVGFLAFLLWQSGLLLKSEQFSWLAAYLVSMISFSLFRKRQTIFENRAILSHFAAISYPLYVCHALLGYAVIYIMMTFTGSVIASLLAAFLSAYAASLILHFLVEKPFLEISKKFK